VSQLAYLAQRLDVMPEGESTVLDNTCLLFLSNMWSGTKHDNKKAPVVTIGGLGGKLETGRALDYFESGDDNRKLCSLYLSIMDRMGVELAEFGDAKIRLAGFCIQGSRATLMVGLYKNGPKASGAHAVRALTFPKHDPQTLRD
jgi:hypothetical protein